MSHLWAYHFFSIESSSMIRMHQTLVPHTALNRTARFAITPGPNQSPAHFAETMPHFAFHRLQKKEGGGKMQLCPGWFNMLSLVKEGEQPHISWCLYFQPIKHRKNARFVISVTIGDVNTHSLPFSVSATAPAAAPSTPSTAEAAAALTSFPAFTQHQHDWLSNLISTAVQVGLRHTLLDDADSDDNIFKDVSCNMAAAATAREQPDVQDVQEVDADWLDNMEWWLPEEQRGRGDEGFDMRCYENV